MFPLGDLGPCQVKFNSVDLGYTHGGVKFRDEVLTVDILADQSGETPVNTVTKGRKCEAEVPLTASSLTILESIVAGATAGASNLVVANTVGKDGRTNSHDLILTRIVDNEPSTDPDETLTIFVAFPASKIEWGFDNSGQRVTLVTFKVFPDDASGNVGNMWRVGPAA